MAKIIKQKILFLVFIVLFFLSSCDLESNDFNFSSKSSVGKDMDYPLKAIECIAPAGTGSGYDITMRSITECLQKTKLILLPLPITNMPGGGGSTALSYFDSKRGSSDILAVYSPPICFINLNGNTELSYKNATTPIARLIIDYGCFAVAKDSEYNTIHDILDELKKNPKKIVIGGTSAKGSMDHIQFLKIAKAGGVERIGEIEYVSFQNGAAVAKLLGGHVDLISIGITDAVGLVESGDIRVLGITSDKRVGTGIVADMPSFKEQGIDATFFNWRGVFGAPDMPEYARKFWEEILFEMQETEEWKEICGLYGWDRSYLGTDEFNEFLDEVNNEYAVLLDEIGMLQ